MACYLALYIDMETDVSEVLIILYQVLSQIENSFSFRFIQQRMSTPTSVWNRPPIWNQRILANKHGFWYVSSLMQAYYSDVIMGAMVSQVPSLASVYSTVYSDADQRKHQKLRVTGLCEGNSSVTGEFPVQRASNAENVSVWWRHHGDNVTRGTSGLLPDRLANWGP